MAIQDTTDGIQHGGDHYKRLKIQPIDFAEQNQMTGMETEALKHLCRHRFKAGILDLKKMFHYGQMLARHYYGVKVTVTYEEPPASGQKEFGE